MRKLICVALIVVAMLCAVSALAEGYDYDLTLTRSSNKNVLSWSPIEGADCYQVFYSSTPGGKFKSIATVTKPKYTHKKSPEVAFYKVRGFAGTKKLPFSDVVGGVAAVKSLKANMVNGNVKLTWKKDAYATEYYVQRAKGKSGPWETIATVASSKKAYTDKTGADVSKKVYYRIVSGFNGVARGASESVAMFLPVSNIKVTCKESYMLGPEKKLFINWTAVPGATGYEVFRAKLPSDNFKRVATTTTNAHSDTRAAKATYAYKVRAIYGDAQGQFSPVATLFSDMPANIAAPSKIESPSGIVLVVNKAAQVVTAYGKDAAGEYTVVLRHMICSTGKVDARTPVGTHTLTSRQQWYRYPAGTRIRYPVTYRPGLFFHSVLYNAGGSIIQSSIRNLGTRQSLGCIRLKVNDAKWVYDNCTSGTPAVIEAGKKISALTSALKPKTIDK